MLRTTKSVEITPQGWQAYRYAVKILNLRDCILESCSANAQSIIRLGASTIPAAYLLPDNCQPSQKIYLVYRSRFGVRPEVASFVEFLLRYFG